ncbi:HBR300Wp [Eremothecium sinecaudum]|uniref:HBR300Wp n=1 Tax=Eremothecium sinecaudum TaxID=45286 RepID=A0A120K1C2_9SACH|nr:HBR300Wp [Eremothecium sinecaudum]AMD19201.1 HBR300Wp [Eremothecium sinecaudum]
MDDEEGIPEFDHLEFLRNHPELNIEPIGIEVEREFTSSGLDEIDGTVGLNSDNQSDLQYTMSDSPPSADSAADTNKIPEFDYAALFKSNPHLKPKSYIQEEGTARNFVTEGLPSEPPARSVSVGSKGMIGSTRLPKKKREPQVIHLLKKVDLETTTFSIILPLFSLFHLIIAPPTWNITMVKIGLIYYFLSQLSLVAGYHRFFTHQSYQCHIALQFFMAVLGASCGLGSISKFSGQHLAHHRHLDTEKDPQCLTLYGWWFAQWGHMLFRGNRKSARAIEECRSTLESTARAIYSKEQNGSQLVISPGYSLLKWQEKNYFQLWVLTNLLIPSMVAKFVCNLPCFSCIFYLGLVRMSLIQQQWLIVGSLCHLKKFPFALQPYDDSRSSVNLPLSIVSQIITFGESNHNFHHEFPGDFRNGSCWYGYDPAKWVIVLWKYFGLADQLHKASNEQIKKAKVQQQQKIIDDERSKLQWGIPIDSLPVISPEAFTDLAKRSYEKDMRALVAIGGIVHDVTPFIHDHPGGVSLVICAIGKDATPAFNGAVYQHSTAARNLLATMRIARLSETGPGVQQTSWDKHMLNDSTGQRIVRNGRQATFTRINHYAAGAA